MYSLNRGLWIGLAGLAALGTVVALLIVVSPLGAMIDARLEHGKSNDVRMYVTTHALEGLIESPLIGLRSTRTTSGGRNSIAVTSSSDCERCGNFTLGGNGQLRTRRLRLPGREFLGNVLVQRASHPTGVSTARVCAALEE
ncbi:MAG: hypothetical protein H0T78_04050 [Longispora sp.]|nr:hypothetical protein [Longispora sp. (in: high G+C Gram-positive bacteria)]